MSQTARTTRRSNEALQGSMTTRRKRMSQEGMGKRTGQIRTRARSSKEFVVSEKWAPPRRPTTVELGTARKTFFELDRDGSGSIDAEELGMMLRSLGQNPSEEELKELIDSVDDGDKDGQIQLREFLLLYTNGLDTKNKGSASKDDINNIFNALGGDPWDPKSAVEKGSIAATILENYDLDVDLGITFGKVGSGPDGKVTRADIETIMIPKQPA